VALYVASLLVFVPIVFRLAETSQGVGGCLSAHELLFGVLEFTPVGVAVLLLVVWHRWGPWVFGVGAGEKGLMADLISAVDQELV